MKQLFSARTLIIALAGLVCMTTTAHAEANLVGQWNLSWNLSSADGSVTYISGTLVVSSQTGPLVHGTLSYLGRNVPFNGVVGTITANTITGTVDGGLFNAVLTNSSGGFYRKMRFFCITPVISGYQDQTALVGTGVRQ